MPWRFRSLTGGRDLAGSPDQPILIPPCPQWIAGLSGVTPVLPPAVIPLPLSCQDLTPSSSFASFAPCHCGPVRIGSIEGCSQKSSPNLPPSWERPWLCRPLGSLCHCSSLSSSLITVSRGSSTNPSRILKHTHALGCLGLPTAPREQSPPSLLAFPLATDVGDTGVSPNTQAHKSNPASVLHCSGPARPHRGTDPSPLFGSPSQAAPP